MCNLLWSFTHDEDLHLNGRQRRQIQEINMYKMIAVSKYSQGTVEVLLEANFLGQQMAAMLLFIAQT